MADSPGGIHAWPTTPADLADNHKCPGCFTVVSAPTCPVCGFVLTDPRALYVLRLGQEIVAAETKRREIIDRVRLENLPSPTRPAAAQAAPAAVPVAVATTLAPQPAPEGVAPSPIGLRPAPVTAAVQPPQLPPPLTAREPRPPRRRLSVPILLLIVGVSLVGVAAVFFLVYAWFTWGIAVRALIIGAVTIATIAIASLLRRRSLTATAEGIAVLGVLLLSLDAWAVRANDFFGTAQVRPALYYGAAVLVVGLICRVWARLSKLRSPDIAAVLALPTGLGLLVGGITSLPIGQATVAGLLGAAAGGLAHALPAPWSSARARADAVPERTTLAVVGIVALVAAAILAAVTAFDDVALPLWSGAAIIALGVAHAFLLRPHGTAAPLPAARTLAGVSSATAAAVATLLGWQVALRSDLPIHALLIGPLVAVAVPVALDRLRTRVSGLLVAQITATALGVLSLFAALIVWLAAAVGAIALGWTTWQTDAVAAPPDQVDGAVFAAIAGVLIAAALFLAPSLGRPVLRSARLVVASVVLLTGVSVVAIPALLVGAAALVAVVALVVLRRPGLRVGATVAAGLGAATAFAAGTTAPWLWLIGVAIAIAVPIAGQLVVRPAGVAAGWLSFAPVGVATVATLLAPAAIGAATGATPEPATAFVLMQWVALAALVAAVLVRRERTSRVALAVSGYSLFLVSLLPYASAALVGTGAAADLGAMTTTLGEPGAALVRCASLLVLLALIALQRTRVAGVIALIAAALVAAAASLFVFSIVRTLGLDDEGARALATVGAAVAVMWAGAAWSMQRPLAPVATAQSSAFPPAAPPTLTTRAAVDSGALATVLLLGWDVPADLQAEMLAVVAAGFVAASVSRGWAGPLSASISGVPSIRRSGAATARSPRRLLAWPAFALATAALWSGLSTAPVASSLTIEAYAIPPAVGLLVFAVLLVWLRRHAEAAIAITASFLLGLALPGLAGWSGSPVRGTVVAIVAALLCLVLTWTPAIRARIPALAGATTALFALALVSLQRAIWETPGEVGWLMLLVGVAYVSAVGAAGGLGVAHRRSLYAAIVPPLALAAATAAGVLSADRVPVLVVAFAVLAALHIAAAALARDPLGTATRWTSLGAAIAFAAVGFLAGTATIDGVPVVELVSLPVALTVLVGSAVAQWRSHRRTDPDAPRTSDAAGGGPEAEHVVWLAAIVLAVLPSVVAPVEPLRVWLGVIVPLLVALVAVLIPLRAVRVLRASSAVILTAAAVVMGARALAQPTFPSAEYAVHVAGAGALLVAAALVWSSAHRGAAGLPTGGEPAASVDRTLTGIATAIAGAGAALLLAAVVVLSDGEVARTTVSALIAAVAAVGGAAVLGRPRWQGIGAVLAIGGFAGALVAITARLIILFTAPIISIEPDLWAVIALGITAAIGIMALRATAHTSIATAVATTVGIAFAAVLLFFTVVEFALLGVAGADAARTLLTMSVLTGAGVAGWLERSRLGLTPPIVAAVAAAGFGIGALVGHSVTPVELVSAPPAVGLLALGARALRRNPRVRTWPALGPGLALLMIPSLLQDFTGDADLWRVVALGVVAVGLVVVGAVWRLQAPLVLGSIVLLVHGIAQLWPWISSAYVYVPWWLWLGIGGAVLIYLAARYESSMRALRTSFTAVASLR